MGYADLKIKADGLFLKFEPGVPLEIRLLDADPVETMRHTVTDSQGTKSFECEGPEHCSYCLEGDHGAPKQRFLANVYDHASQRVKIMEFGAMIAKQLKAIAVSLAEEKQNIMDTDLKIEARGSGFSRKYEVTPRIAKKEVPLGLKLHELRKKTNGANADDIPF